MRVTYVGHSTVLIATDGVRLLTDPILRGRVAHLRRKGTVPAEALEDIDAVLISHMHMDHLDRPSIQRLGTDVPLVVPRGAAALLRRKRFRRIIELAEGEDVTIGGVTVTATHADHEGDRLPFGASAPAVGYRIAGERSAYFAGDTDLFDGMDEIGGGGLDVALLPIAGWGPTLPPGHLTPATAAAGAGAAAAARRDPDPLGHAGADDVACRGGRAQRSTGDGLRGTGCRTGARRRGARPRPRRLDRDLAAQPPPRRGRPGRAPRGAHPAGRDRGSRASSAPSASSLSAPATSHSTSAARSSAG